MFLRLVLLLGCLHVVLGQCDFYQYVTEGVYYDIKSPNYPYSYKGTTYCRWRAETSLGNKLKLSCGPFNIPKSVQCVDDRLSVSLSGDDTLSDAHAYCGVGTFTLISDSNKLTMVLQAPRYSAGGSFLCNITAIAASSSCYCGWKKQNRIVGGTQTGVNEYPMMAALIDDIKRKVTCGCTIISKNYVITAAHCVRNKNPKKLSVLVGDHDITTGDETSATRLYNVSTIKLHEGYDTNTEANDIALLKLITSITFSQEVLPACLPFLYSQYDFAGADVTVLGWGSTEFGASTSDVLLKADLKVLSPKECSQAYGDSVTYKQMCTFSKGKDACQSDSGGPVLWQNSADGRVHLLALISYGVACATDAPGVNTRVSSYLSWITENTPGETYCRV